MRDKKDREIEKEERKKKRREEERKTTTDAFLSLPSSSDESLPSPVAALFFLLFDIVLK